MSESLLNDLRLSLRENYYELQAKIVDRINTISDVIHENMFITGYENLYIEGMKAFNRGRYSRAIFYFEKANIAGPKHFNCLYNLALSYQYMAQYETAINYYIQALNLVPEDRDSIYNLGLCYLNNHNGEFAEEFLQKAYENNPDEPGVLMSYILGLVENKKTDEAIEETIKIVKSNKSYLDFTLTVAKHIEALSFGEEDSDNITKVIKLINSYLKINDKSASAHIQNSMCYGKLGNWGLALKHSLAALELNPKSHEINSHTGLVLYCSQSYEEALKYYKKALELGSAKNFDLHMNIALTYEKLGMINDAKRKVKYILKYFKGHPNIAYIESLLASFEAPPEEEKDIETVLENEQSSEAQEPQPEQNSES